MIDHQIIDIPFHYDAITHNISLTGCTLLKQSKYKSRHSKTPNITQIPRNGFVSNNSQLLKVCKKEAKKKAVKKDDVTEVVSKVKSERRKIYRINKKEVTHRVRNYVHAQLKEKQLYFWTITFFEGTNDDTAFLLLNKWLTRLRHEKLLKSYLWISERQKNGTIHFHLIIPHRLCVKKANKYMRASIMHCINNNEISITREQAKNYNGVDIAKDRKTKRVTNFAKQNKQKSLANYLTKYITKNDSYFTHLAWHCSRDFSNLIISVRFTDREILASNLYNFLNMTDTLEGEYYIFYKWKGQPPPELVTYLSNLNAYILDTFFHNTLN